MLEMNVINDFYIEGSVWIHTKDMINFTNKTIITLYKDYILIKNDKFTNKIYLDSFDYGIHYAVKGKVIKGILKTFYTTLEDIRYLGMNINAEEYLEKERLFIKEFGIWKEKLNKYKFFTIYDNVASTIGRIIC